jgi:hypothetical protein
MTHAIWLTMPINDDIRSQTESFVNDVTALIRRAALDAVRSALASGQGAAAALKAVASAKKAAPAKAAPAKKAAPAAAKKGAKGAPKAAKKAAAKRASGAKRPPAELAALVEKLGAYIKGNPGQGAEAIGKALSLPTSEMTLPIKKLLAAKRIRSEGQKRATKYFPA